MQSMKYILQLFLVDIIIKTEQFATGDSVKTTLPLSKTLVRQAQLGASYRVTCHTQVLCMTGSLYRVKPSQQPVPSVA